MREKLNIEFDKTGYAYPVIKLSKDQIKKLEELTNYDIETNDDISYCIGIVIDYC